MYFGYCRELGSVIRLILKRFKGGVDTVPCPRINTPRENGRNPFCPPDFLSGDQARGTREVIMSRTSPRTLLLHIPLTDPLRRIYRLADSRSGTLESPAGRFFDPSVVGSMTTARPPLSLLRPSQHLLLVSGLLS